MFPAFSFVNAFWSFNESEPQCSEQYVLAVSIPVQTAWHKSEKGMKLQYLSNRLVFHMPESTHRIRQRDVLNSGYVIFVTRSNCEL